MKFYELYKNNEQIIVKWNDLYSWHFHPRTDRTSNNIRIMDGFYHEFRVYHEFFIDKLLTYVLTYLTLGVSNLFYDSKSKLRI